jgi:hypothetical protein
MKSALMIFLFLFAGSSFGAENVADQARKMVFEMKAGEAYHKYTIHVTPDASELQLESLTQNFRKKLSVQDATFLKQLFKELPVVPTLPADCARDFMKVEFVPSDERPRATCLLQATKYTPPYRKLAEVLGLATLKMGGDDEAAPKPAVKSPKATPTDARD